MVLAVQACLLQVDRAPGGHLQGASDHMGLHTSSSSSSSSSRCRRGLCFGFQHKGLKVHWWDLLPHAWVLPVAAMHGYLEPVESCNVGVGVHAGGDA
jgi:hypothetical protein